MTVRELNGIYWGQDAKVLNVTEVAKVTEVNRSNRHCRKEISQKCCMTYIYIKDISPLEH